MRKASIVVNTLCHCIFIKLADRLHNVRTLAPLPPEKRRRIAEETIEVYAPLAHRLGVQEIKHELEERSFAALHPARRSKLEAQIRQRAPEREVYLERVMAELPAEIDAEEATLCGEFNEWDAEANPMKQLKNGSFSATVSLPAGVVIRAS